MVTFNFTDPTTNLNAEFGTSSMMTISQNPGPISFTTAPGGLSPAVTFTLTPTSTFYGITFSPNSDQIQIRENQLTLNGTATATITWTNGAGSSRLVNPVASITATNPVGAAEAFWTLNGAVVGDARDGVQFNGVVTGIRFVTTNQVILESLDGTLSCFAAGTQIATPSGAENVEDLRIGDYVTTLDGEIVEVKWIGRETTDTRFGIAERRRPVKVRAGAFGPNLPDQDLVLTADHALFLEGLLINAAALVDGQNVYFVPTSELEKTFTVYHIETENHDLILANNLPAETFIDYVSRRSFDNYAEYSALYGDESDVDELTYPRIASSRLLPEALRHRTTAQTAA